MDFQKVLEALDHLIENRVESAAYTRMLTAIVQDIENSENNTYKVSYDNGKTVTIAVSIAPNGSEIQYQKGDSVQLLQYNGIGNTNTTLYILGKSADFTEQNLADLEDYFTSITSFPIDTFTNNITFELNDGKSVIENIKKYGSFILKAKFTVDSSKEVYNYGIKITLNFTNDIKPIEYIFDTYQMIGQPWLYNGIEQSYQQKIDEFYLPYLNSITLTKFVDEGHSITINNLEICSAILNISNDYTAMFKGSEKSIDFITDNQDNKANTTLQTVFYKNGQTFASSNCKYYWFIRDDSIEIGNKYYHKYGGVGWKCLNKSETIEYLNEESQKIFNNDIGDTLTIDKNNAPQYHNYYKCVVEYGLRIAATQEKEVLNLDKTNINFTLTTENITITKLDENTILNLTLNLSGDLSILKKISWYYQRDDQDKQYLIKSENALTDTKQYILFVDDISDKLGKEHTIFTCVLLGEGNVTLGQCHITITRDLNGELTEEIWYYDNGDSIVPPTKVDTTKWTTDISKLGSIDSKYVFAAKRMVSATYQGPFSDIYCYSAHGTGPSAAQLTEFNRLTNNGKDRGLFYGSGYIKTIDTTKQNDKIYYYFDTETKKFVKLIGDFQPDIEYYEKFNDDQALYINADYINTGTLRVGNSGSEKFYASVNSKDVKIGGFIVNDNSIYYAGIGGGIVGLFSKNANNSDIAIYVSPDNKTKTDGFYVDYSGNVYCKKMFSVGTKDKGFSIDETGKVNWTANNTPIKYIYCSTALAIPEGTAYDKFPDTSDNNWHKTYNNKDHWYAISTSGEAGSFNGPLRLDGEIGEINILTNAEIINIANSVFNKPDIPPAVDDPTISFNIDGTSYTAEKGNTFITWRDGSYYQASLEMSISSDNKVLINGKTLYYADGKTPVNADEEIQNGENYTTTSQV